MPSGGQPGACSIMAEPLGVVVLAIFASIFSGFLSASLANRIGWEAAPAHEANLDQDQK
ncbi:hypothetical protein [Micromonospora sp. DT231]|uniref:hypothetical protein n=1 Tax=Micromonospora sp. DT231 TaxID=3416526 RepID=UPI003CF07C75